MADKSSLKVKFNWELTSPRSQTKKLDKTDKNNCEKSSGTSRSAKFVRNMKATQPSRLKEHLEKDAARKMMMSCIQHTCIHVPSLKLFAKTVLEILEERAIFMFRHLRSKIKVKVNG